MRPNHQRRQRGRNGKPNKFPNRNQSYDSNGPDVRVRGTAHQIYEKYQTLAREAATSGDVVAAEAYYQYAEHYFRIIQAQGGFIPPRFPQPWEEGDAGEDGPGDGQPGEGGGFDPADGPQPNLDYAQRGGAPASGEDYPQSREAGYNNGEDRYRGRDDGRGGENRSGGEGRGYDQRRQDRRDDDANGTYNQRGRRDFVTRGEQRFQDRQDRPERGERAPAAPLETRPVESRPEESVPAAEPAPAAAPVVAAEQSLPFVERAGGGQEAPAEAAADAAAGDGRGQREGRAFRARHPHFRRFRGGPRGQNNVDPAQQDQPDLTGGGTNGTGSGT
jgi:hypothetical protein